MVRSREEVELSKEEGVVQVSTRQRAAWLPLQQKYRVVVLVYATTLSRLSLTVGYYLPATRQNRSWSCTGDESKCSCDREAGCGDLKS